jgi:hypothetical protein
MARIIASGPAAIGPAARFVKLHLARALRWDLRGLPLTDRERRRLAGRGVEGELAAAYLAWRRSTFLVLAALSLVSATWHAVNFLDFYNLWPNLWTPFGLGLEVARLSAQFALPVSALVAALSWARPRWSRRAALAGWLVALLGPVLLAFFPLHWSFDLDRLSLGEQEQLVERILQALELPVTARTIEDTARHMLEYVLDLLGAVLNAVLLLPALLSLMPGSLRACVRVKLLLPESVVPGWFLVVLIPYYALYWVVAVTVVVNLHLDRPVVAAAALMAAAPLAYLLRAGPLVRPLPADAAQGLARVRLLAGGCVLAAFAILFGYLLTKEFVLAEERIRLVGFDENSSIVLPWDLLSIGLDYLTRSLFTTAVVADLFLQIHLSAWRRMKESGGVAEGDDFDRRAEELGRALAR